MGRLEKIVVLTVLFLVAVVLGVALNPGTPDSSGGPTGSITGKDPGAQPPGALSATVDLSQPIQPLTEAKQPAGGPNAPATGAPAVVKDSPEPAPSGAVAPAPAPQPVAAPFVLTTEGLSPSGADGMMFYTWKQGDTLAGVAQHYYGSKDKLARLQKANEGRAEASLKPGDLIWIQTADSAASKAAADPNANAQGTVYLVQSGDMLSKISTKFYGTSKKWQKILDANRDILSSPEQLQPGMKLRIPE